MDAWLYCSLPFPVVALLGVCMSLAGAGSGLACFPLSQGDSPISGNA